MSGENRYLFMICIKMELVLWYLGGSFEEEELILFGGSVEVLLNDIIG